MEKPMPDLSQATSVKRVKRGYRRVSMMLKVSEYDVIAQMAEQENRTPDQQAAYMLRRLLSDLRGAYDRQLNGPMDTGSEATPEAVTGVE
jgi:hypothetical protein